MATGCFKGSSLSAQHAILMPFFKGGGKRQCSSLLGNIGTGVSLLCSTEDLGGASDASTQSSSCKNMAALSTGASFKKKWKNQCPSLTPDDTGKASLAGGVKTSGELALPQLCTAPSLLAGHLWPISTPPHFCSWMSWDVSCLTLLEVPSVWRQAWSVKSLFGNSFLAVWRSASPAIMENKNLAVI